MPSIRQFCDDLRKAYLNDPTGRRIPDVEIRPYFLDAITGIYASDRRAFYGLASEARIAALHDMSEADLFAVELNTLISPAWFSLLRDKVWEKASATSQRGQATGAPLARQQAAGDNPQ